MFFGDDFGLPEILFQTGSLDLSRLLHDRTLCHQDEPMPGGKILQRFRNFRQKFYRMICDCVCKTVDLSVQLRRDRPYAEPLKRIHQCVRKAVQSVSMLHNALSLHIVEHFADLLAGKFVMIEKRNKADDGSLEVDVIFPKRIVRVDE